MSNRFSSKDSQLALLVVNGNLPREEILRKLCDQVALIVCTDGAADQLRMIASDAMPSVIVGDIDSLQNTACYHEDVIIRINDQHSTDLEKALGYLVNNSPMLVVVVGFSGCRYDHTITNLQILSSFHDKLDFLLIDDLGYGVFLSRMSKRGSFIIDEVIGTTVSLIPIGRISGITTAGLHYPLENETLGWGERSGQSNRMNQARATVELIKGGEAEDGDGTLLVYVLPPEFDGSTMHIRIKGASVGFESGGGS